MKYSLQGISTLSIARFGCLLGWIVTLFPSLTCGLVAAGVLASLRSWLEGLEAISLDMLGFEYSLDLIELLKLGDFLAMLQTIQLRTLPLMLALVVMLAALIANLSSNWHILGTDKVGKDVLYQGIKSIRTGLVIGTLTTLVMLPFAVMLGIMAGYFRGWVDDVIQYIYTKYGRDRAALAATLITYRTRSALRDVGKSLGLGLEQIEALVSAVSAWRRHAEIEPAHLAEAGFDPDNPTLRRLRILVNSLRGFPRHLSQHVGGFVIAAGRLDELVPIENAAMAERSVIQWEKDDLEALGLLKVDVLALGMLSAIR